MPGLSSGRSGGGTRFPAQPCPLLAAVECLFSQGSGPSPVPRGQGVVLPRVDAAVGPSVGRPRQPSRYSGAIPSAFLPSLRLRRRGCPWPRRKPASSPLCPPRQPRRPAVPLIAGTASLSLSTGPFPSAFNTLQSLPRKASDERKGHKNPPLQ